MCKNTVNREIKGYDSNDSNSQLLKTENFVGWCNLIVCSLWKCHEMMPLFESGVTLTLTTGWNCETTVSKTIDLFAADILTC